MKFVHNAPCQAQSRFLLSICIPTYNRCAHLKRTIESIVSQAAFKDGSLVELVVLDNDSQDATPDVCQHFLHLYPSSFVYNRQEQGVQPDINFRDVLNLASGSYLKLNNDTLVHSDDSLQFMLEVLANSSDRLGKKITPFFSNGLIPHIKSPVSCVSTNDFLRLTYGISTYIGAFGVWREDFHQVQSFRPEIAWKNSLGHVDCLFRLLDAGHSFVIYNNKIACIDKPANHGGYDVGKVFLDEYLRLCWRSYRGGHIAYQAYICEVRRSIFYASSWFNNQILYPNLYSFKFDFFYYRVRAACLGDPCLLLLFFLHQHFDLLLKLSRKTTKSLINFLISAAYFFLKS